MGSPISGKGIALKTHLWFLWMRSRIVLISSALVASSASTASRSCARNDKVQSLFQVCVLDSPKSTTTAKTTAIWEYAPSAICNLRLCAYVTPTSYVEGQAITYGSSRATGSRIAFSSLFRASARGTVGCSRQQMCNFDFCFHSR